MFARLNKTLLGLLAVAGGFSSGYGAARYSWDDSKPGSHVIVNATQGIEACPREWFAQVQLVTDFEITNVAAIGETEARRRYWATRGLLESYGLFVGTYISGTSVMPETTQKFWPPETVALERMPISARYTGVWPGSANRKIVDIADVKTRHALQKEILRMWKNVPAPARFVDNAAIHHSTGAGAGWSAYCANIKELRNMGAALGSLQIFNIAVHVGLMSDDETLQLISAVADHGICLELPWHRSIRRDAGKTEMAKRRYRQLLDSGMGIIMMPLDGDPQELVQWVSTWRKPSDHIYLSALFYKPPALYFHN
jgi:hypothetical protein